ncbi:heterokaryon incompatibility protein-domain-containing protein [Coniella lustricola]|uniref:Heterokaryon incompatibility protein-domain-containing protein n=1 Tax=Coniella lustricola TaxID=2025994 RepID=A0A2T3A0H7_9PEZI|nr:heterokaryon incompatibility protein-domain-containing protein [Coniella lustricola]
MDRLPGTYTYEPLGWSSRRLLKNDGSFPPPDLPADAKYLTASTRNYHMDVRGNLRILSLLPGLYQDPLRCYLSIMNIDDVSAYDAISYEWGMPGEEEFIWLDQQRVSIRSNLAAALRSIRDNSSMRFLWIDAICINQADKREKTDQINLMKEIYSRAESVLVWIDEVLSGDLPCVEKLSKFTDGECGDELGTDPAFWAPLIPILRNSYWDRLWIQQEVVFAKRLTIYCRGAIIEGHRFMSFQHQVFVKASEGNIPFSKPSEWTLLGNDMKITESFSRHLLHWRLMIEHRVPVDPVTLKPDFSLRLPDEEWAVNTRKWGPFMRETPIYLLGMLRYAQRLGATEPRDRVAATLNLAIDYQDDGSPFAYDQDVTEAYMRIGQLLLFKCNSLLFLPDAKVSRRADKTVKDLPSWAPNWNPPGNASYFQGHYNASGDLPMYKSPFQHDLHEGILHARGIQFDRIQKLIPGDVHTLTSLSSISEFFFPPGPTISLPCIEKEVKQLADTLTCPSLKKIGLPLNHFNEAERILYMALVLCYGAITPGLRISDLLPYTQGPYGSSPGQLSESLLGLDKFREQRSSFSWLFDIIKVSNTELHQLTPATRFGQFVLLAYQTLESGRLCVGSSRDPILVEGSAVVKQEDEIWVLFSCPVPMVLRREGRHHRVISPSYIHNSMNGEQVHDVYAPESHDPSGWSNLLETGRFGPKPEVPYISGKRNRLVEIISIR